MRVTITARHCDVADELRTRARDLATRLARVAHRPQDAHVLFAADHGSAAVEVRLHAARGRLYVARDEAPNYRTALDRAAARVRRQLEKAHLRPRRRRRLPAREPS
jgi:ribosome-associated translation inhibitor RaiA